MHCDVASGFNFNIGHFLQLNRVEREKSRSAIHRRSQDFQLGGGVGG